MNTNTTIERIESVNTVPSTDALPTGVWSAGELLTRIDERSHPMTDLQQAPTREPNPPTTDRWRGPAIALGIAAAILLVAGVVGILMNRSGDDVAPAGPSDATTDSSDGTDASSDPMDVIAEFDRRYDNGDPSFVALYDPSVFGDESWIALQVNEARYAWATGLTDTSECSADGPRVTCTYTETSGIDPSRVYESGTLVYTISGGKIVGIQSEGYFSPVTEDRSALAEYREWVRVNHPDKFDDLFLFGQTLAIQTDELVRLQRQMIAQYHEATGKG